MTISPVSNVTSVCATQAINQRTPHEKPESPAKAEEDTVELSAAALNQLKTPERG